ncbi:tRNA ligase subunit PheS family protein [Cupriavidus basilensis]
MNARLSAEAIDVTLPGRAVGRGSLHPAMRHVGARGNRSGSVRSVDVSPMAPEIESDWMNFTALINPDNHPARSMQDTVLYRRPRQRRQASRCYAHAHQPDAGALRQNARGEVRRPARCRRSR